MEAIIIFETPEVFSPVIGRFRCVDIATARIRTHTLSPSHPPFLRQTPPIQLCQGIISMFPDLSMLPEVYVPEAVYSCMLPEVYVPEAVCSCMLPEVYVPEAVYCV